MSIEQDEEYMEETNPETAVNFQTAFIPEVVNTGSEPLVDGESEATLEVASVPPSTSDEDDEPTESPAEENVPPFTPPQGRVKFTLSRDVDSEMIPAGLAIISFLRENPDTFDEVLTRHKRIFTSIEGGEVATSADDLLWLETLQDAITHIDMTGTPRRATEREGSHWVQSFEYGGRKIGPSRPKIKLSDKPSKSDIDAFLNRKSGLGATHEFPMPHTGIWIRLRTPTNTEIANMLQRLQGISVRLGRDTKGQGFSNRIAVYNNALVDLAMQCITHTNMVASTPGDIEHRLSALDEPMLFHGLASTMYPGGFNYSHSCIADPSSCSNVETAKLDMFSLTWFDYTQLNDYQKNLLHLRFSRQLRAEELDQYAEDTTLGRKPIKWFDDIGLRMRVPTIAERRDSGNRWIEGLIEESHSAFNEAPGDANRNAFIDRLAAVTSARQYGHWVDAIYHREDEHSQEELLTTDTDSIDRHLSNIMSDKKYSARFEAAVLQFIDDTIMGMVAIPSWDCPVCNTPMAKKFHERFPHLIPIDVVSTFFTLAGQKVSK